MTSDVGEVIKRAKEYYFRRWRGREKVSPAFGEKVYVTRLGWNHIVHHKRRLLVDKVQRLRKLALAREVLESTTTYQTKQQKGNYILYGIKAIKGDTVVKVVVSQREGSAKKVLYSVMFKSLKRQEQRNVDRHNQKMIREFKKRGKAGRRKG